MRAERHDRPNIDLTLKWLYCGSKNIATLRIVIRRNTRSCLAFTLVLFSAMFTFVADHQAADARKPTRPSSACKAVSKLVRRGVEYGVQATESKFKLAHDQLRDLSQSTVGSVGKCYLENLICSLANWLLGSGTASL